MSKKLIPKRTVAQVFQDATDCDFITITFNIPKQPDHETSPQMELHVACMFDGFSHSSDHLRVLKMDSTEYLKRKGVDRTFHCIDIVHEAFGLKAPNADMAITVDSNGEDVEAVRWVIGKPHRTPSKKQWLQIEKFMAADGKETPRSHLLSLAYGSQEVGVVTLVYPYMMPQTNQHTH